MNQNYIGHQTSDSCDISDNSDSNYLLTANSPIIHGRQLKVGWLQNPKKLFLFLFYAKKVIKMQKKKVLLLHFNISDTPFDQKSPQPPEEGVLKCHRQTDIRTSLIYDWIGPVGQFSKIKVLKYTTIPSYTYLGNIEIWPVCVVKMPYLPLLTTDL